MITDADRRDQVAEVYRRLFYRDVRQSAVYPDPLERLTESLSKEVADFGIKVTILEPTGYSTGAESAAGRSAPDPDYGGEHERRVERRKFVASREGNPEATAAAVLAVVDADEPPLRLLLGAGTFELVTGVYESRLATWRDWAEVSTAAHG